MLWTIHDVRDELETAIELLRCGDTPLITADAATAFHVRARATITRAYQMAQASAAAIDAMIAQEPDSAPATVPDAPPVALEPVAATASNAVPDAEAVSNLPPAFIAPDTRMVRAIGGPFKDRSLAMYPNRTRWIVRDAGGVRVSVFTDSTTAPADAFPRELAADVKVEGFYHTGAQDYAALWTPIVEMADRVNGKLPT